MVDKRKDPDYEQVTGHISRDVARRFKIFCTEQRITIAHALEEAIGLYLQIKQPNEVDSSAFLKMLAQGKRPSDAEISEASEALEVTEEELLDLRDRLFPRVKNGDGH